ncbi:hypothetical protein [Achromobacter sp. AGC39]
MIGRVTCKLRKVVDFDVRGQGVYGAPRKVKAEVLKIETGSGQLPIGGSFSGTQGHAEEISGFAHLLFPLTVQVDFGDRVELDGKNFRVTGVQLRRDAVGRPEHYEVKATHG